MLNKAKSAFGGKKILIITFSTLLILAFLPVIVFAQSQGQGNQVQNQNQVQIQNQGEEQQLQVGIQEREILQEEQDGEGEGQAKGQPKSANSRSENAREQMSVVAQKVEELLMTQEAKGGIGQQVSRVAKEQQQAQEQIQEQFNKLKSKSGLMKKLFGPDYKAIKNLKRQMEQNQLRIQQLEQLQVQIVNQADQTQVQATVQALAEQNTALEEQIQAEEKAGSIFGWLIKLFVK